MKRIMLFLSLLIINYSFSIASVRYVSHSGSNTPPYLTWETAADSIMSAINISSFGDTIYVANGVYEEQVVMIPGLSLIGAGMDSCVVDTRIFATTTSYRAVLINNNCLLKGFQILVANNTEIGGGIGGAGDSCLITQNRITKAKYGIYAGGSPYIYNNIVDHISSGIYTFNSNSIVRKNTIYTDPNSQSAVIAAIRIEGFDFSYHPLIDSNYIETERVGIDKSYGTRPTISNNKILLTGVGGQGILLGGPSDTARVLNNEIYAIRGMYGIYPPGVQYLYLINNYFTGNFDDQQNLDYVITLGSDHTAINNVVTNAERGILVVGTQNLKFKFNNIWNNDINYSGFTPDSTNTSINPMVINPDSTNAGPDFHLQAFSPLIDRGDPNILDKDSSRSDIGLYGGPYGEIYRYIDLPPRTPVNFIAILDTEYIKLSWNRNTETDFSNYNLYRDTMQGFPTDSSTLVASIKDTFYIQTIPPGIANFFFRVTAVDYQGNESEPSEERHIEIVSVKERPKVFTSYQLYQNFPNPFNPSTKIGYRLKERGYVKLYVYDIKGELVQTLFNQYQNAGYYEVDFNSEVRGQRSEVTKLSSGIYIYQLMVKNDNDIPVFSDIKKMILLK
ncbi:MAG TPA: hypothetical protein VLB50_02565 [Ignavibacteriaceae bacterium]|nr:hypothetical protein [Ignavibacteriaceae bacterium]